MTCLFRSVLFVADGIVQLLVHGSKQEEKMLPEPQSKCGGQIPTYRFGGELGGGIRTIHLEFITKKTCKNNLCNVTHPKLF